MQDSRRNPPDRDRVRHGEHVIEHLLRRAGFGAGEDEIADYMELGFSGAVRQLIDYQTVPDDVDALIGKPGYVTVRGGLQPRTIINDSRQRWLFRMIHSRRPLQEKMTLFWHNHFATAYSKVAGAFGADEGARYMAAKPRRSNQVKDRLSSFGVRTRQLRDLLVAVARTPPCCGLDGRRTSKDGHRRTSHASDGALHDGGRHVRGGGRVCGSAGLTGWKPHVHRRYSRSVTWRHSTTRCEGVHVPVYPNGSKVVPARAADAGMQDGIDLINAVAGHPLTGPRLARKLHRFFISEVSDPDPTLMSELASIYYRGNFEIKPVVEHLLRSPQFVDGSNRYARYSWPAEFVARSIKEIGWVGFSLNDALGAMSNMGQQLFEPPDVAGWDLGPSWFSSGAMLTRMNFASQLATNQRFNLRDIARGAKQSPEALVSLMLDRLTAAPFAREPYQALVDYARAGGAWTGSDAQLLIKAAGVGHLIVGSGDYQLV